MGVGLSIVPKEASTSDASLLFPPNPSATVAPPPPPPPLAISSRNAVPLWRSWKATVPHSYGACRYKGCRASSAKCAWVFRERACRRGPYPRPRCSHANVWSHAAQSKYCHQVQGSRRCGRPGYGGRLHWVMRARDVCRQVLHFFDPCYYLRDVQRWKTNVHKTKILERVSGDDRSMRSDINDPERLRMSRGVPRCTGLMCANTSAMLVVNASKNIANTKIWKMRMTKRCSIQQATSQIGSKYEQWPSSSGQDLPSRSPVSHRYVESQVVGIKKKQ